MIRCAIAFSVLSVSILCSCAGEEIVKPEPERPDVAEAKLVSITDERGQESFKYDDEGRVVEYDSKSNSITGTTSFKVVYDYPNPKMISVSVNYAWETYIRKNYNETLCLNDNGVVELIEGNVECQEKDCCLRKEYCKEFIYNSDNELTDIIFSEWEADRSNTLSFKNHLTWEGGNLKEYVDCAGGANPVTTISYGYYENFTVDNKVRAYPLLLFYYQPLQLAGIFGKQSKNLVKEEISRSSFYGNNYEQSYTYNIIPGVETSVIGSYIVQRYDIGKTYKIGWQFD